ncbi:hypothetical protein LguiA_029487 [Lonicera macranthoides]
MFRHQRQILTFLSFFFLYNSIVTNEGDLPTSNSLVDKVDFLHSENNVEEGQISVLTALKPPKFVSPFSRVNTIATGVIIVITLLNIIVYKLLEPNLGSTQQLQDQEANLGDQKASNKYSTLATEQLPRRFSLPEILSATNNFDDSKVIGRGGFGNVYKGVLDSGAITVAIKRLNLASSKQGAIEFLTEIEMLPKFRHRNLISLIGYCDDCDEMIIVYEYMTRGALAGYLYKIDRSANNSVLSWVQRLKICLDAARGLEYLHTGTNVIHRDMKSSNILLDDNLTAKVSDFGMSKVGPKNDSCSHVSTQVKGTSGYLDPEYWMTHKLTKKSDVYSFGVVLLEVLSGKAAFDFERTEEQRSLVIWAQRCIKEETLNEIIDPSLTSEIVQPNSLASFIKIPNQSVHHRSKKRPTMAEVVSSLESALALQERKDSSIFDRDLLSIGLDFGNQDIEDSSSGQPSVTYYDSGQQHREETNKTDQEIVDYSSKLHQITPSSNNRDFYSSSMVMKNAFVETTGPFGGQGGGSWDDGAHTTIRKLIIYSEPVIQSIQIEYDENGRSKSSKMHGRKEGKKNTVKLDYPHEFLVSVSGYVDNFWSLMVFHSLTLESNKRKYGPFGIERGKYYKFPSTSGNKIVGFFGRSGYHLDSIGVYFEPTEPPIIPVGPFGGQGRDSWDDGAHTAIVKLIIYSSEVELDYPSEFLVSVSGYIDEFYSKIVFRSLTLESNKRTYGPFGREKGKFIKFPSRSGHKILGFFGSSSRHLDSLGAYVVQSRRTLIRYLL